MTYRQSIEFLTSLIDYERWVYRNYDFKLDDYFSFLNKIGNPQTRLDRTVLVAGTKGKGSTAIILSRLLSSHGERVGLYTSPHILDYRERISIDGKMIPAQRFSNLVDKLNPAIKAHKPKITFFEALTTIGMLYFLEEKTTVNVLEVGLGGRLDATNVTNPEVSIITRIGHDHTQTLGTTLAKIAAEKCGILRQKGKAVIGNQHYLARNSIRREIEKTGTEGIWWGKDFSAHVTDEGLDGLEFHYQGLGLDGEFRLPLIGAHHADNAATTLAAGEVILGKMDPGKVWKALSRIKLPSRIEIIRKNPAVVVDMSHNQESAATLARTLNKHFSNCSRRILLIGITRHKKVSDILRSLAPFFTDIYVTSAHIPRAIPYEKLHSMCERIHPRCRQTKSVQDGIKRIWPELKPEDILVVTGSVYVAGEALRIINCGKGAQLG